MRAWVAWVVVLLAATFAFDAHAVPSVRFGSARGGATLPGLNELFAAVDNDADRELGGTFSITFGGEVVAETRVVVPPREKRRVHLPAVVEYGMTFRFVLDDGRVLREENRSTESGFAQWAFDLTDGGLVSRLDRTRLEIRVATPDRSFGEPVVPRFVGSYAPFTTVVAPITRLATLAPAELEALGAFVLAGGTLAVYAKRPEDLRDSILEGFAGGVVAAAGPPPALLRRRDTDPPISDATIVSGAAGGNLEPSAFGAVASYGLGRLVVLGFDPERSPHDPWVANKILDLIRDGRDLKAIAPFAPGGVSGWANATNVRELFLDRARARVALVVATVLLVLFALLAGPLNYRLAWRSGRPARALAWLACASAVTFMVVVVIGVSLRGTTGQTRHVVYVDAAAGMSRGVGWRIRSFYSGEPRRLQARATHETSSLFLLQDSSIYERSPVHGIDNGASMLANVELPPWKLVFVREDATFDLGGGLSVIRPNEPVPKSLTLVNRTGTALTHVIARLPDGTVAFTERIEPGESVSTDVMHRNASTAVVAKLLRDSVFTNGNMSLYGDAFAGMIPEDAARFWVAAGRLAEGVWFPGDAPVILAEVDLPIERTTDSGFEVTSQRSFVRFVGYGGTP